MGEIYTFKTNNSLSRDKLNYDTGTIKNIHYGDIHTKFPARFDIRNEIVPFINPSEQLNAFHSEDCVEGDMIFADASEDLKDIGKSIELVHLNGERVVAGLHTILARPDLDRLAIGFGAYLFQSRRVRAQIQKEAQGAKVLGISATRLSRIQLPLPPTKAEQQKIAACLSSLDDLIEAESRKLDALKAHKRGLMQRLFPREGETVPQLRFPEFRSRSAWEHGMLKSIAIVLQGYGFPEKYQGNTTGQFPFYKVGDISRTLASGSYRMGEAANYIDHETLLELRAKPIPPGTTIFARIGEALRLNRRGLTTKACLIDNNCAGVKAIEGKATDLFLYYLFSTIELGRHAGGVVPAVNKSAIEEIKVSHPEQDEQIRISNCLSSLDDLISVQSEKLEILCTHKRGLMQQLFPRLSGVEA